MLTFPHRDAYFTWTPETIKLTLNQGGLISLAFHGDEGGLVCDFELRLNLLASVEL